MEELLDAPATTETWDAAEAGGEGAPQNPRTSHRSPPSLAWIRSARHTEVPCVTATTA